MVDFKEKVYELAFGDNAISRSFTEEEVLTSLERMITEFDRFRVFVQDVYTQDGDIQTVSDSIQLRTFNQLVELFEESE